jgi:hypothetical protein
MFGGPMGIERSLNEGAFGAGEWVPPPRVQGNLVMEGSLVTVHNGSDGFEPRLCRATTTNVCRRSAMLRSAHAGDIGGNGVTTSAGSLVSVVRAYWNAIKRMVQYS